MLLTTCSATGYRYTVYQLERGPSAHGGNFQNLVGISLSKQAYLITFSWRSIFAGS